MIISSVLKIYDTNNILIDTVNILNDTMEGTTTALSAGSEYYCTVESTNDEMISSGESAPYTFYSLPNIQLTGYVNRDSSGFIRQTTITTDVVNIEDWGLEYDTTSTFNNPKRVSGTTVNGLDENTTYYYRPWVMDEFGRTYVNTTDSDSVTTLYATPKIDFVAIYGATVGTFSALINITSSINVSSVVAELTTSGNTITKTLTAQTGQQYIDIVGLSQNTNYTMVIKATNAAGTGVSNLIQFNTQIATEDVTVSIIDRNLVSGEDNTITAESSISKSPDATITSHYVYVYNNDQHEGSAEFSYDCGTSLYATATFSGVGSDSTYWLFSKVIYSVSGNSYTVWSDGVQIHTYSLFNFTSIEPLTDSANVTFMVDGESMNTQIEYSENNVTWVSVPINDPQSEMFVITGLNSGSIYYIRGRAENQSGWCDWVNDTFSTTNI